MAGKLPKPTADITTGVRRVLRWSAGDHVVIADLTPDDRRGVHLYGGRGLDQTDHARIADAEALAQALLAAHRAVLTRDIEDIRSTHDR